MIRETPRKHPFAIDARVLLPEHMHCIWTLPSGDTDYSTRRRIIKGGFSKQATKLFRRPERINRSEAKHRESTIWQRRFWEHEPV
jgi:putative transposase